jgi:hypothetical protein
LITALPFLYRYIDGVLGAVPVYWVTQQAKLFTEATYTFSPNEHGDENQ